LETICKKYLTQPECFCLYVIYS